ncbi:MAG: methylated-DNA--[protein]-cysteine S-methyltransferase, partial [Alphaproteobacteria bacterium]|nr:methylated-DNA--[protein]-cysteine S-methyltransferase [Alphaproteobacteria bacterium]
MVKEFVDNIISTSCSKSHYRSLNVKDIDTPIGMMVAIADKNNLELLEFIDRKNFYKNLQKFQYKTKAHFETGTNKILDLIESELADYFVGKCHRFSTPIKTYGSDFQNKVWKELCHINAGYTKSYADIAISINHPSAYRAVANANASNRMAIIIPCHRVISSHNKLSGYAGGVERKKWLIEHEKKLWG